MLRAQEGDRLSNRPLGALDIRASPRGPWDLVALCFKGYHLGGIQSCTEEVESPGKSVCSSCLF